MAKDLLRISLLILTFTYSSMFAAVYYVDAVSGNDSNNGTSPSTAWKTISKVNSKIYIPGDNIYFKRGQQWQGMLIISASGTNSANITYGAYGSGPKPIITTMQKVPNSDKTGSWSVYSGNIWKMSYSIGATVIDRLWLSDKEYINAGSPSAINSTNRWCTANNVLYVYSASNPATYYSGVVFPGGISPNTYTVKIDGKDYITIENLDLKGGYTGTIGLGGADYVTIQDCNIGYGAHGRGIIGDAASLGGADITSDRVIVRRDTLNSGWNLYTTYDRSIMDGISIQNGANYWEISECYFKNWGHSAIQIYGITAATNYNKIFKCTFTAPDISYGRAFETVGSDSNMCRYNEFYRNLVTYTRTRNQVGGYRNKIYYNIFDHMLDATVAHGGGETAQALQFAAVAGPSKYNKAYNNTIYSTTRYGIWDSGSNSEVVNNLIIETGSSTSGYSVRSSNSSSVSNSVWKNNYIYVVGFSTSNYTVLFKDKAYTVAAFNSLNGTDGDKISGNTQHVGDCTTLVVNAKGGNYAPSPNSCIIDKGVNVGLKEDFYGNPIAGNPEIGAIEFTGSTTVTQIAPVITSTALTTIQAGQSYSYDVNATGSPAPAYSLKTFPQGMIINSSTGLISWVSPSAGSYNITIEANNGVNPAAQQSFTLTVASQQSNVPLSPGLISYWTLNETSGSSFADKMKKNNAVGLVIPKPITGKVGGAQQFNGSTTKINVPANPSFDFTNQSNFTVEFWFKGSTIPTTVKSAVGRYIKETGARWYVGLNPTDGKAKFYMYSGGTGVVVNGTPVVDGTWHHIVAARNGSGNTMKIYVDGALKASVAANFPSGFTSSTANLNIGWFSFQDAYALNGCLDEVAIYNTELSSSEILQHYKNGTAGLEYFTSNYLSAVKTSFYKESNINTNSSVPDKFGLMQNYPNPFNPATRIKYAVSEPTNVTIKIYDMLGAEVMTLVNDIKSPGYYEATFDGSSLASGIYIYQLRTNNYVETKKMMLMK